MADTSERDLRDEVESQLLALLAGGQAHANFAKVIEDFPEEMRGVRPERVPYSAWQLLEHLRIAQKDILMFCTDGGGAGYKALAWPADYWPKESSPATASAWDDAIAGIRADRDRFEALLKTKEADLATPFPWGHGQNLLREALLIADHTAYHLGEMILLRRLLGIWKG